MKRVAVISAVLDEPEKCQVEFNKILTDYKNIIKGRMGIPFEDEGVSVISVIVIGDMDTINGLTGKLGRIQSISVKTSVSKKEVRG
ncbi:MAG: iron-only hydrogenase system regulator [Terrisporobacter sp.]|uniref:TM1266 family iron-only hydrogenase system putative regulator n=1 Tax=Terrisporobacter sp. TaxID=1965305 RepID=UPI002FC99955